MLVVCPGVGIACITFDLLQLLTKEGGVLFSRGGFCLAEEVLFTRGGICLAEGVLFSREGFCY